MERVYVRLRQGGIIAVFLLEWHKSRSDLSGKSRIYSGEVALDRTGWKRRELRVETGERDFGRVCARHVILSHPKDQVEHLFSVPNPAMQPRQDLGRITSPVRDIVIDRQRLGPVSLDCESCEAHLGDEEFQEAMLELKELASALCGFAESHDPRCQ